MTSSFQIVVDPSNEAVDEIVDILVTLMVNITNQIQVDCPKKLDRFNKHLKLLFKM